MKKYTFRGSKSVIFILVSLFSRGLLLKKDIYWEEYFFFVQGTYNFDNSRARAYCACSRCGWGWFGHFYSHLSFSFLSPSLWETARYRLKYCLKGPLSPKQPTNQSSREKSMKSQKLPFLRKNSEKTWRWTHIHVPLESEYTQYIQHNYSNCYFSIMVHNCDNYTWFHDKINVFIRIYF